MSSDWLAACLVCEGRVIRPAMDPSQLTSKDLPDICIRMSLILDTIEFTRCQGRMIDPNFFEPIDTLYSDLLHKDTSCLSDWQLLIARFGDYYELAGNEMIEVSARTLSALSHMFDQLNVERSEDYLGSD